MGIIQLAAASSLFGGGGYGRVVGIFQASVGALGSRLSIGGTHPWCSPAALGLGLYILHGLGVFGEDSSATA